MSPHMGYDSKNYKEKTPLQESNSPADEWDIQQDNVKSRTMLLRAVTTGYLEVKRSTISYRKFFHA